MRLSTRIRWCHIDDVVVVLDIARGAYFALDPETSRQWMRVADEDGEASPRLLADLRERGWLGGTATPAPSERNSGPICRLARINRYSLALFALLGVRLRIARHGFASAYDWAAAVSLPGRPPSASLEADLRRFIAVEALVPSRRADRDCLPRSLALYVYLRCLGHEVRHVIGVGRFPFDAHAWVEHRGTPLLERDARNRPPAGARAPRGRTPIAQIG
ncbi:MAG: lasso peptide biosynthesis B2 protein [Thiohalocapsa sp.]|nr:lasso peptide biosynthesis B2 protein [Thiohalocapsa sp.]MCF7989976.1 lasso peptide biosynthesis B2 protein [Thiohalocapsa sp.]